MLKQLGDNDMGALLNFINRKVLLLISAAAFASLSACGSGDSGTTPVVNSGTSNVSVSQYSDSATQPKAVVNSAGGAELTYYGNAGAASPSQAVLKQKDGGEFVTYFNADGTINKIVNSATGDYTKADVRRDKTGVDYITYSSAGGFVSGISVFTDGLKWYSANVLGDLGQITVSYGGSQPGSGVLVPTTLAYDVPVEVGANLQQLLNTIYAPKVTLKGPLWILMPSAHAVTTLDTAKLTASAVLIAAGIASGPVTATGIALVAIGGIIAGKTVTKIWSESLNTLEKSFDSVMSDRLINDMDKAVDPGKSFSDSVRALLASGLTAAQQSVVAAVERKANTIAAVALPPARADSTVAPTGLPVAIGNGLTLTGTTVNSANTVYAMIGSLTSAGALTANGTAPDNTAVSIAGSVAVAAGTLSGTFRTNSSTGTLISSGNLTAGAIAQQGKCSTNTQSGGNGTFSFAFNVGKAGTVALTYNMFSIPDALTLLSDGATVFSTGGLVSGSRTIDVVSTSSLVILNISAPNSGTAWEVRVGCAS
jgi:hypothetical protein